MQNKTDDKKEIQFLSDQKGSASIFDGQKGISS
jgi:hypothetical protein